MSISFNPEKMYGIPAYPAEVNLEIILRIWKGENAHQQIRDKNILDLASGSENSRNWPPYFARICAQYGASVIALDLQPQSKEDDKLFKWASLNLVEVVYNRALPGLTILEKRKFDIINSTNFVGFNRPQELLLQLRKYGLSQDEFETILLEQLTELLNLDGIISLDQRNKQYLPIMYQKIQGKLTAISP